METPEELQAFPTILNKFREQNDLEEFLQLYAATTGDTREKWLAHLKKYEEGDAEIRDSLARLVQALKSFLDSLRG